MKKKRTGVALLSLLCVAFLALGYYVSPLVIGVTATDSSAAGLGVGCVLVMRYSGQQGSAVKALDSLQRWIRDVHLPMVIVEPIVQKSVMGVRQQGVRFSDLFDLDQFNAVSRNEGVPGLLDWPTYLAKAPRTAVLVKMTSTENKTIPALPQVTWNSTDGRTCANKIISGLDKSSVSLCLVRTVTSYWRFASKRTLSMDDIHLTILKGLDLTNITLIFSLWREPWELPHSPLTPHTPLLTGTTKPPDKFRDSPRLQLSSQLYQQKFLSDRDGPENRYVAVMIRAEHTILELQHSPHTQAHLSDGIEKCMHQLLRETDIAKKNSRATQLLVTSDVGRYGSGTWKWTLPSQEVKVDVEERVMRAVEMLYDGSWSFEQWEDSFVEAGGVDDRGYVAALQRVLATQADCFVLFGGGLFQELSLEHYLRRTSNHTQPRCIRLVCVEDKYLKSFHSMIKNAGESIQYSSPHHS